MNNREIEEGQRILNGHMRWGNKILNLAKDWDQEHRAMMNLLNHGLSVCPMTVLIKDHKTWSVGELEKSRPVINGKVGNNCNLSEFVLLILEPIANEDKNNMETNATDGLIADIEKVNHKWKITREEDHNTLPTPQTDGQTNWQVGGIVADPPEGRS